ncbi:PepSY domain-containing protein [Pseudomonas chengduensis]|jgi:hypothetical protein|nr:PepSY domain-containing protein [Pseudomonas chengduensis]MBG0843722.1 PepSY domain-containing protein [Pseudomonas chengduensis]
MSSRRIHLWSGVVLAIPMFIVGITAVFIAHDKSMGLKDLPLSWLPMSYEKENELRSAAQTGDGQLWFGSKYGVFQQGADGHLQQRSEVEVRQLLGEQQQLWVASKEGLYLIDGERIEQRLDAEVHGITRLQDGQLLASVKDEGALLSRDGLAWQPSPLNAELASVQSAAPKPYTFGKLVMDLHTGKAFFGKSGEWIWIDVLGITLALLGLTGVWIWWQSRRRAAL